MPDRELWLSIYFGLGVVLLAVAGCVGSYP